jgi:hypothetical protein
VNTHTLKHFLYTLLRQASLTHTLLTSGKDPWVHKGGHAEVGEGEEEDHSVIDGNDGGDML